MTPDSPITLHNRPLAFEVLKRTATFSRYPRVSEQLECLPLETQKLKPFSYNPAINSREWMAYRYHVSRLGTRLAFAEFELGRIGKIKSVSDIEIPSESAKSIDDPRFFYHDGYDYMSWVEANWDDKDYQHTIRSVVKYGKCNYGKVTDIQQPNLPGNDGSTMQKNYVAFGHKDYVFCIYQCHPTHRIYNLTTGDVYETEGPKWAFGEIRGGTPSVPYEGKLLRFFHSRLSNEWFGPGWRYYLGAYLMNPEPPFEVVRVSRRPVLYGSEIGTVKAKDCPHWKANIVFASGCVESNGAFTISVGENDSASLLVKVTPEQLNF